MSKPSSTSFWSWIPRFSRTQEPNSPEELKRLCTRLYARKIIRHEQLTKICRLLDLDHIRVKDVMIPRVNMTMIQLDQSVREIRRLVQESGHSRFPVLDTEQRKVIGIVLAKDLVIYHHKKSIRDLIRDVFFVPESKRIDNLLNEFQSKHQHMAIVVDEYGDHAGLVTIEDIIEQITGDIEDEHDLPDDDRGILQLDNDRYVVQAMLPLEDFNASFNTQLLLEDTDTIGGIILSHLGYIPTKGVTLSLSGLHFEIHSANEKQILSLIVTDQRTPRKTIKTG